MRVQKRSPWLNGLGAVLAAMALWGAQAEAGVSSDKPGSVVMWPKVIADGTRDTVITLTNTRNEQAYAHCEYVQALGLCSITGDFCDPQATVAGSPGLCPTLTGNVCVSQWQSADFDVVLTRQQPTMWRVSTGRVYDPFLTGGGACVDTIGPPTRQSCPGLFLIGMVPPALQPFRGELRCFQVASDGSALPSNGLKGEAVLETLGSTQISEYNSINVEGLAAPTVAGVVRLNDIEYSACPEAVEVSHYAQGADDLVASTIDPTVCTGSGCPVEAEITIIPCRADFINEEGARFATDIRYTNEFEQTLSVEPTFDCWANFDLRDLPFAPAALSGTTFQRTRIIPTGSGLCITGTTSLTGQPGGPCSTDAQCGIGGVCGPVTGILAIVEEFHNTDASLADPPTVAPGTAASNGYSVDFNSDNLLGRPGHCRGNLTQTCAVDADCPIGFCRINSLAMCDPENPMIPTCESLDPADFCDRCMNDEISFEAGPIVVQQ
ncbi:MAG: hypothetical protein ABI629_00570 [bacterium]